MNTSKMNLIQKKNEADPKGSVSIKRRSTKIISRYGKSLLRCHYFVSHWWGFFRNFVAKQGHRPTTVIN